MKYVEGFHESNQKEFKLFKAKDIKEASIKSIEIEEKNWLMESKKGDKFKKYDENLILEGEQSRTHINTK